MFITEKDIKRISIFNQMPKSHFLPCAYLFLLLSSIPFSFILQPHFSRLLLENERPFARSFFNVPLPLSVFKQHSKRQVTNCSGSASAVFSIMTPFAAAFLCSKLYGILRRSLQFHNLQGILTTKMM